MGSSQPGLDLPVQIRMSVCCEVCAEHAILHVCLPSLEAVLV